MRVVARPLRQFGPITGGGGGTPPNVPTFVVTDNLDGTVTITIAGSSIGATNDVYLQVSGGSWELAGSRSGNGNVLLTLEDGRYFVYIQSTLSSQSVVTPVTTFRLNNGSLSGLEHSPADIIRYLLIDLSQGTIPQARSAWPIYTEMEPDKPDNAITTFNTSGITEGKTHKSGQVQEHFGVQIRLRSQVPEEGFPKMRSLQVCLDEEVRFDNVVIGSSEYLIHAVTRKGGVLSLGKEPSTNRYAFTLNVLVSLKQLH